MKLLNTLVRVGIDQCASSCLWHAGMLLEQASVGSRQSDSYSNNPVEAEVWETLTADLFAPAVCSDGHIILQCCSKTVSLVSHHTNSKPGRCPQIHLDRKDALCNIQGCCGVDRRGPTTSCQDSRRLRITVLNMMTQQRWICRFVYPRIQHCLHCIITSILINVLFST